ncbi:MAG: helix-turn-helix domain-containing protein [Gemmatimonas sp.]|jgi:DNA-binding transcriptional MerR regulator|uniref:helix-turn-helix domain-containing protein n=1 Tax=Gemmatimonas sp. TaxID=1962908 RepID=UPI0031CB37CF|nr:helix-turn-helix domain-containing protein [Gemmatimonas sp.]
MSPNARRSPDAPGLVIGELATRTATSPETIRYYERIGLLPPPQRRGSGRYRMYSAADVVRLAFVRRARALGFSTDAVRDLLGLADDPERPCGEVGQLARAHLMAVEDKLAQLTALRDELQRVIGACAGKHAMAECRILGALSGQS